LGVYTLGLFCLVAAWRGAEFTLARWPFSPWILVWYSVTSGPATVTWSGPETGAMAQVAFSSVLRAPLLVAVGIALWVFGYLVGLGRRRAALRRGQCERWASG